MLKHRLLTSAIAIPLLAVLFWVDSQMGGRALLFSTFVLAVAAAAARELAAMLRNRVPKLQTSDVVIGSLVIVAASHIGWFSTGALSSRAEIVEAETTNRVLEQPRVRRVDDAVQPVRPTAGIVRRPGPAEDGRIGVTRGFVGACLNAAEFAAITLIVLAVVELVRYEVGVYEVEEVVPVAAAKVLAIAYVGGGLALASQLRWLSGESPPYGLLALLLITVKSADVGAYTFGRLIGGRHPLKRLSPKKTLAGFVGGWLTGVVCFLAVAVLVWPTAWAGDMVAAAVVGVLLSAAGIIGDLVESLLKRGCGVKDSGQSIPGFGGVLDLVDSPLFAGAVLTVILANLLFLT